MIIEIDTNVLNSEVGVSVATVEVALNTSDKDEDALGDGLKLDAGADELVSS